MVSLVCAWCGTPFEKAQGEYNRRIRLGYDHFFCCYSCSSAYGNAITGKHRPLERACPVCHTVFMSSTSPRAAVFCSHKCAALGTVTPRRREASRRMGLRNKRNFTLETTASGLRVREAWKYAPIKAFLDNAQEPHIFEYPLNGTDCIYDLALLRRKTLVEFDTKGHYGNKKRDLVKDQMADKHGWKLVRLITLQNAPIHPDVLDPLFAKV